jgi:hypothetical protein
MFYFQKLIYLHNQTPNPFLSFGVMKLINGFKLLYAILKLMLAGKE